MQTFESFHRKRYSNADIYKKSGEGSVNFSSKRLDDTLYPEKHQGKLFKEICRHCRRPLGSHYGLKLKCDR